jgi:hypothetical protein
MWRSTVKRWLRYFKELFANSINYRRLSGHLMPPIGADQLPRDLLARFYQMDPSRCLTLPNAKEDPMNDDQIPMWQRLAQFRFAVIGELLSSPPEKGQLQKAIERLSQQT